MPLPLTTSTFPGPCCREDQHQPVPAEPVPDPEVAHDHRASPGRSVKHAAPCRGGRAAQWMKRYTINDVADPAKRFAITCIANPAKRFARSDRATRRSPSSFRQSLSCRRHGSGVGQKSLVRLNVINLRAKKRSVEVRPPCWRCCGGRHGVKRMPPPNPSRTLARPAGCDSAEATFLKGKGCRQQQGRDGTDGVRFVASVAIR